MVDLFSVALEEGVELVLDEAREFRSGAGLGVGDEAGRVLLHQHWYDAPAKPPVDKPPQG
jgi:hypothetical protein